VLFGAALAYRVKKEHTLDRKVQETKKKTQTKANKQKLSLNRNLSSFAFVFIYIRFFPLSDLISSQR
jgi:hypothetical protein